MEVSMVEEVSKEEQEKEETNTHTKVDAETITKVKKKQAYEKRIAKDLASD